MSTDGHEKVFLATTALEEFWDTTRPMVFLGEWCLLYGRRSFWESLKGQLLESPFDNGEAAHAAYHYVNEIYERILPLLGDFLNKIHNKSFSTRYWRIVLGPWLHLYLSVIYDRYITLLDVLGRYPDFTAIGLSEESFVVPRDTLEFVQFLKGDPYNLQIYTNVLLFMEKEFPRKNLNVTADPFIKVERFGSIKGTVKRLTKKIWKGVGRHWGSGSIVLRDSYFSRSMELKLFITTRGKVWPVTGEAVELPFFTPRRQDRKTLQNTLPENSEFEKLIKKILPFDIPQCFIEGFNTVTKGAGKDYPAKPKGIFSANAWHFDEAFKQWAAISAEKGTLLIGTSHGGNYGGLANMPFENHETAIVDRYYSWGWERADCTAEVIPFPSSKLVGIKKNGASNRKSGILWVATACPRYFVQAPFWPKHFQEYLSWQFRFVKTLLKEVMDELRLRPHYENNGWEIVQRLHDCIPCMQIETWEIPFLESLANCRLYVCDHLSTTFAEALAANKPTILFWNPQTNELRPEAQPYYDLLRKSGILFNTPESAGKAVNHIYDDVETWWNVPERQNAVEVFCERFARTSPDAIELWVAEFKRVAKSVV